MNSKRTRRIFSLILALLMVFTMLPVTAFAAQTAGVQSTSTDVPDATGRSITLPEENPGEDDGDTVDQKNGDNFAVEQISPVTESRELTAIQISSGNTIAAPKAPPGKTTYAVLELKATAIYADNPEVSVPIAPVDTIWSITNGGSSAVFLSGYALTVASSAIADTVVTVEVKSGGKTATKNITITKGTPVFTAMLIKGGVDTIAVPAAAFSPYDDPTAFTVTGYDQYGQEIAVASPSWSIDPSYTGLSISSDAKLSITKAAAAGTATVKVTSGSVFATKDVTVTKDSVATEITISEGVSTVAVPTVAAGGTTTTSAFKATVEDQYGDEMASPTVTWSIDPAYPGVTIAADGTLTVSKEAAAGSAVVKATCGTATKTVEVTITKADSVLTAVRIYKNGMAITTDTVIKSVNGSATLNYTAEAVDQFDEKMTGMTFSWGISPVKFGAEADNGTIIFNGVFAEAGEYTVEARCGDKTGIVTITVSNKALATVTLDDTTITYGETYTPNPSVTEAAGGTWSYSYTGTSYDGTYTGGDTAPAAAGKYEVTATYESATHFGTDTATLTIGRKELTISGVTATNRTYDGTDQITLAGGTLNGKEGSDDVSFALGTATIADKNVGTDKAVSKPIELVGDKRSNYTLKLPTDLMVDITPAPLNVTYTGAPLTKAYDGSTSYSVDIDLMLAGLVPTESTGTLKAAGGTYNTKDVATADKLILGTLTATGFNLSNYRYTLPTPAASITAKPVDVIIDGDAGPVQFGTSFSHAASAVLLTGDTATYTVLYKGNAAKPTDAGTYPLSVAISNTNYTANPITASFIISKAAITDLSDQTASVRDTDTNVQTYALSGFGEAPCAGAWKRGSYSATLFSVNPAISGNNLTYTVNSVAKAGDSGTIMLQFIPTDPANYKEKTVTLTINVIDKKPATVTVSMDGWKYGETAKEPTKSVSFADSQATTNDSWLITYTGTLSDGSSTAYAESATKPTDPGTYTIKAVYEDDNHKGEKTDSFTIEKSDALTITGLTADNKVYNNTTTATVSGTLAVSGKIGTDDVTLGTVALGTATFADAEVDNNKNVTVTLTGAVGGADAWKYEAPATTLTLKANITKPARPVVLGNDMLDLAWDSIAAAYSSYSTGIKGTYVDATAVQTKLLDEAKSVIPTIGSNIAYYDLKIVSLQRGTPTNGGATILFPYPSGTSKTTAFVVVHMKGDGSVETPAMTKGAYGVEITVTETSPFAIAWRKTSSSSSGGSGDASYDFWKTVKEKVGDSKTGAAVRVDAKSYDQMPWTVMQALRQNPNVSLVIDWNGGDTITIPAGKALADEPGRIYYPLSYLAEKYRGMAASDDQLNPDTGGRIYIEAPAVIPGAQTVTPATGGIDRDAAILETTPLLLPEAIMPSAQQESARQTGSSGIPAAIALTVAALAAGGWIFRKREEQE